MKKSAAIVVKTIFYGAFAAILIANLVMFVTFKQEFSGYLKQAADANTVELAEESLLKSIRYLEEHEMTEGNTAIFWETPANDVGYFYTNLTSSYAELKKETDSTSLLEKSNVLMKLRETLMDHGSEGDELTYPDGLYKFPHNLGWLVLNGAGVIFLIIGFCVQVPWTKTYNFRR